LGVDELKQAKIDVKCQLFYSSWYICLCGATLMDVNHGKLCLLNNMDVEKFKMNQTKFQYQSLV
jgi:hypothetical protein